MRTTIFMLIITVGAFAADQPRATYYSGSVNIAAGTTGKLDLQDAKTLTFEHSGRKLTIAYERIAGFNYSEPLVRRLGVLPIVAVGLFKRLDRRHLVEITYLDEQNVKQVLTLDMEKRTANALMGVLRARSSLCLKKGAKDFLPSPCSVPYTEKFTTAN